MSTILIVIVVLMLLGAFPTWNHSRSGVMARAAAWVWSWSFCSS